VDPENAIVLWPSNFDTRVSREHGRKVSKREATEAPTARMLFEAVKSLKLDCILELEKSYPRYWYRNEGRVLVEPKLTKKELIRRVASALKTIPREAERD
jgi:signal recognition particle subunit SRP19